MSVYFGASDFRFVTVMFILVGIHTIYVTNKQNNVGIDDLI